MRLGRAEAAVRRAAERSRRAVYLRRRANVVSTMVKYSRRSREQPSLPVSDTSRAALISLAAWAVPGVGHLWLGRVRQGFIFLVTLPLMFMIGLWLGGRIFPFEPSEPLVFLASLANVGVGAVYLLARAGDLGAGDAVVATYEYGNSFLIVSGLLNMLVVIDAYDVALARK